MASEVSIFTGQLNYDGIDFTFVFDGTELRLIPPKEKCNEIWHNWIFTPQGDNRYTLNHHMVVKCPVLRGNCNESSHDIIFIIPSNSIIGYHSHPATMNVILYIHPAAYVVCKYDRGAVDRISFSNHEIDYIHPMGQACDYSFSIDPSHDDGVVSVTVRDFDSTTTKAQEFFVDDIKAYVQFGVTRGINYRSSEFPLKLNSSLIFDFEPTNDYMFIYKLWCIAKSFIQYLCYRKDISPLSADLYAPYEDNKHERFATLYVLGHDVVPEHEPLKKGCYIKQAHIAGFEGRILSDLAGGLLYTRHLPESYESGRHYDAARFVMITAAFEWEFRHTYPQGIPKKDCRLMAEKEVQKTLHALIEKSTGKVKSIYKHLEKMVGKDPLQSQLVHISNDYDSVVGLFGRQLYGLNEKELIYSEMGKRLADQRNHFAHGDLDEEMIADSLLDLMFLEYIIYAMQLKHYGVSNRRIQMAINDLFHRNISDTEFQKDDTSTSK